MAPATQETVLITGASSGIGCDLARCFAADGSKLVLVARKRDVLNSVADDLHRSFKSHVEVLPADLAEPVAPRRIFEQLQTKGTKVDVLVNNAGIGLKGQFAELPLEQQLDIVRVNVTALTHLTRLLLPGMISRQRGGILNVASTASFQPGPGMAVYYASKAYVLWLTEALAEELRGTGVTATALCPGPTATNFFAAAGAIPSRLFDRAAMSSQAVAQIGHSAFRRGRVIAVAGFRNRAMAFSTRLAPRSLVRKIASWFNAAS